MLTLPYRLRYLLAWNHELCRAVLGIYARTLLAFQRRRAQRCGIRDGRSGCVTVIQRFGGGLNLNIHFHTLVLDGVFTERDADTLRFHPAMVLHVIYPGFLVFGALVSWSVLIGNFLAALAMLAYFFSHHRALSRRLVGSWSSVLYEGTIAGLVGAAVVALWFLAIDTIQGEPLRTPTLLGRGLLKIVAAPHPVLVYTLVHGMSFVVFGIVAAVLIAAAERAPAFLFAVVILFTAFEVFFFGVVIIGAKWVLDELAGWTILVGNLLASAAMLAYFFKTHHALARRLTEAFAEDD